MIEAMRITLLGDLSFDALASGPEGGEPALLLHGWPQFADCWCPIMQALAGAGYCAVAIDQRGYSPGARPPNVSDYTMDRLVADALGFADQLGWTTFHLIAHDWGGMVARTLAGAHPDRLRSLSVLATPHPVALSTEAAADDAQYRRLNYIHFSRKWGGHAKGRAAHQWRGAAARWLWRQHPASAGGCQCGTPVPALWPWWCPSTCRAGGLRSCRRDS